MTKQQFTNNLYLDVFNVDTSDGTVETYALVFNDAKKLTTLSQIEKTKIDAEYPHVLEWARDVLIELPKGKVDQYEAFAAIAVIKELLAKEADRSIGLVVPK